MPAAWAIMGVAQIVAAATIKPVNFLFMLPPVCEAPAVADICIPHTHTMSTMRRSSWGNLYLA